MPFGYNVYFSDRFHNRVFSYTPDTGEYEIIIGDAPVPRESPLLQPYGVAYSPSLGLLVANMFHNKIVNQNLEEVHTYDPNGHRSKCRFKNQQNYPWTPAGIFQEKSGALLVSYSDDGTIYRVQEDGRLDLVLGISPAQPYTLRRCNDDVPPGDIGDTPVFISANIVAKEDGTIFFIERGWQAVREYHPQRGMKTMFPRSLQKKFEHITDPPDETTIDEYYPPYPMTLALNSSNENILFLADHHHRCVYEINLASRNMKKVMSSSHSEPKGPAAVAVGEDGTVWVIDAGDMHLYGYQKREGNWIKIDQQFAIPPAETDCELVGGMGMITR